jgi:hypothetical protein
LDKLGRPWGYDSATKQSCTFKEPSAAKTLTWEDAKDCPYKLTDSNALPDSHGRLWGYDGVAKQSCAFKSQNLPAGNSENGATSPGDWAGAGNFVHICVHGCAADGLLLLGSMGQLHAEGTGK